MFLLPSRRCDPVTMAMPIRERPTLEALAERLSAKRQGANWSARCPAHEDARASLSLAAGKDGRVLLTCHAGCSLESILGALGLEARDLFPAASGPTLVTRRTIAATYDYRDEEGRLLYQVVRYQPKDFRQRVPDGNGGWRWGLNGTRRVVYRLPEVMARPEGSPVWIVEGEKDADTLAVFGLAATCNPMGAGKWEAGYRETFRGAEVLVVPDNDGPGQQHAAAVAASLHGMAASVRLVTLPRGKDVSEYLASGGTVDSLQALARSAAPFERAPTTSPPATPPERPDATEGLPRPTRLLDVHDTPARWLLDRLLLEGEPALIGGDPAAGKSTLALAIAGAVAGGYPALGAYAPRYAGGAPVLIVTEEDPDTILRNRLEALSRGMGWDWNRVGSNVHVLALAGARLDDTAWGLHLLALAELLAAALVVFDPLADMLSGNENSPSEARPVVQLWRALAARGVTALVVAHLAKPNETRAGQHRIRGAGSWAASPRVIYTLERRDGLLSLVCDKMSRMAKPAPVELSLEVEADPNNPAVWRSARLDAAGASGDWRIADRRTLTPSARKALAALERHHEESLSWSRWGEVSGVQHSALSEARRTLLDLGLVGAIETGKRAGKPVQAYHILPAGRIALLDVLDSPRLRSNSAPDSAESHNLDSATPPPPFRGAGTAESELEQNETPRLRAESEPAE